MKCEICGKEIEKSRYVGCVICGSKCFNEYYWRKVVSEKDRYIIIGGKCYCDAGEREQPYDTWCLGHGGRRFWIRFQDGRTITTNNLWCQGDVPEKYRAELPDNAEFYIPEHIKYANALKLNIHGKGKID